MAIEAVSTPSGIGVGARGVQISPNAAKILTLWGAPRRADVATRRVPVPGQHNRAEGGSHHAHEIHRAGEKVRGRRSVIFTERACRDVFSIKR